MKEIENFNGVFCDAMVSHHNQIVFISLWGRAAHLLSLYGGITNGFINSLVIDGRHLGITKEMDKCQTRLPKQNLYGSDLVHTMLYSNVVIQEQAGQRILMGEIDDSRLWTSIHQLSDLALLAHWKEKIIVMLKEQGMILPLEDSYGIEATLVDLSQRDQFEDLICQMIMTRRLCKN